MKEASVLDIAQYQQYNTVVIWIAVGNVFSKTIQKPFKTCTFTDEDHSDVSRGILSSSMQYHIRTTITRMPVDILWHY